jgi:hypothetical protein
MSLADRVTTFGQYLLQKYGERVHKIALNVGFTCPNRDGSKGLGGCSFCNNASFNPTERQPPSLGAQLQAGRQVIRRRTGARRYLAYFQAYTNTYGELDHLRRLYDQALAERDVIGLAVGTRPDCVPDAVLDLLCHYRDQGHEVWLELGLQSAHESTLQAVNRGHGFAEYRAAIHAANARRLPVCTHLILGLPGEDYQAMEDSFYRVMELGVDGLKLHPLHVVKGTQLARQWKRGDYRPLAMEDYIEMAACLIEQTPAEVIYHRVTGTAPRDILLAPAWCAQKWQVINGIEAILRARDSYQGRLLQPGALPSIKVAH